MVKPFRLRDIDIYRIPVQNKILTGTYVLQSNRAICNQNDVNPTSQLCRMDNETSKHFLLDCQELETVRKPELKDFLNVCDNRVIDYPLLADLSLVQLLVDHSNIQDFCEPGDKKS